jgi:serine/threonine protein kinase
VEVSLIMKQLMVACKEIWGLNIIHRDLKLANILLHFPDNPEVSDMS